MNFFCMFKQVILIREDLKLSAGKLAAQVAHGSVEALLRSHKDYISAWRKEGMKKIVLKVQSVNDLKEFQRKAESQGLVSALVVDGGHTEIPAGTVTCLGIGPDKEDKIDKVTGGLPLA
jgi:peptidyl-tRNA hydrolase, PTH2 family